MKTKTTNPRLKKLIKTLKKKEGIWKALGEELDTSNRRRAQVNLFKINKNLEKGETALIPGKVLGYGAINKKIKIGALNYSEKAKEKLINQEIKPKKIEEIIEKNPNKEELKIIK